MKTIKEMAEDYCKSTLVGSSYIKRNAYFQGAMDIIKELSMTISVSEDKSLKDNLQIMIDNLIGDFKFERGTIDDDINF